MIVFVALIIFAFVLYGAMCLMATVGVACLAVRDARRNRHPKIPLVGNRDRPPEIREVTLCLLAKRTRLSTPTPLTVFL